MRRGFEDEDDDEDEDFSGPMNPSNWFSQHPYRCRLDWGPRGARQAAARGDILVIVDTLSFSTTVATAVHRGGRVSPCAKGEEAVVLAARAGAELAVPRGQVPARGRYSLSPLTCVDLPPGTRIVLPSWNGAACSRAAEEAPYVFAGAPVNARAVAEAVAELLDTTDLCVTVIACGERWADGPDDGDWRMAIEDYLGAGAILSRLEEENSPEARLCEAAFLQAREQLEAFLWECGSGRELRDKGFPEDVRYAAQLDIYDAVPLLWEGAFR